MVQSLDFIAFFGYLILVLVLGFLFSATNREESDFYIAGKSMHWIPIGISIMVSAFSAVNFMAFPTEVYGHGIGILAALPIFFLVIIPIKKWIIPFFREQSGHSAYSFLNESFGNRSLSQLAVILFLFWRVAWIALTLFASSKLLAGLSGFSVETLILIMGIIAIVYSVFGGIKAVIWTDVLQFVVLFGSVLYAVFYYSQFHGETLVQSLSDERADLLLWGGKSVGSLFQLDPTQRITILSILIGTFVAFMARYGSDQIMIQRYKSAKTSDAAQKSILLNAFAAVTVLLLLALLGLLMKASALDAGTALPAKKMFILFIKNLPVGMTGLLAAGLLAASMSSIDSGLNAAAATLSSEFSVVHSVKRARLLTSIIGLVSVGLSFLVLATLGKNQTLFVITNKIINGFGSPILALVLLGMIKKGVTSRGLFWGTIIGALFSLWSVWGIGNLALHYYAVLNLVVSVAAIYVISFITKKRENS